MGAVTGFLTSMYVKAMPILADVSGATKNPDGATGGGGGDPSNFEIQTFLESFGNNLGNWGAVILIILGFAAIIAASYMLVTGLISHGKKQTSWPVVIILYVVGGAMAFGGWNLIANTISAGLEQTVENWGGALIMALPPVLPFC